MSDLKVLPILHLRPIRIISIFRERLIPDKQNKLVAINRQTPKKIQVGQIMLIHRIIYPDIHLIEIIDCFLTSKNIMCGLMQTDVLPTTEGQSALFEVRE